MRHNRVNGSEVGFGIDSKCLQEAKASVLMMCSSCNASQLPPIGNITYDNKLTKTQRMGEISKWT